jgi:Domain of unknown function (DUF5664)
VFSEVKDSGKREEFGTGMVRDTQDGKARFDLLLPEGVPFSAQFLTRCAQHLANGARKYSARNWEQAHTQAELDRAKSSAFRHFMQWYSGEMDEDHAAAVFFGLLSAEYIKHRMAQEAETIEAAPVAVAPFTCALCGVAYKDLSHNCNDHAWKVETGKGIWYVPKSEHHTWDEALCSVLHGTAGEPAYSYPRGAAHRVQ